MQQVHHGEHGRQHLVAELVSGEEEGWHCGRSEGGGLGDQKDLARRQDPLDGHEPQEDERRVVAEEVPARDGHERLLETAEQPHPLIAMAKSKAGTPKPSRRLRIVQYEKSQM